MNLTLLELNELIYCVGTALKNGELVNKKVATKLYTKLTDELEHRCNLLDMAENGPDVYDVFVVDMVRGKKAAHQLEVKLLKEFNYELNSTH